MYVYVYMYKVQYLLQKIRNVFNICNIKKFVLRHIKTVIIDSFKLVNPVGDCSLVFMLVKRNPTVVLTNAIQTSSLWIRRANIRFDKQSSTRRVCI